MADRQPSGQRPRPDFRFRRGGPGPAVRSSFIGRLATILAIPLAWLMLLCAGCALVSQARVSPPMASPALPAHAAALEPPSVFWSEPFNTLDQDRWRATDVSGGRTGYAVVRLEDRSCLRAESRDSASILLSPVQFDPEQDQWMSWEWRVDEFVEGEALEQKKGSDASARVYVYFQTIGPPWRKRSLDYVWSRTLPLERLLNSAFSPTSKILVVESGAQARGQWRAQERNLEADFERAFGRQRHLPGVIAIGIMADSDNSNGRAVAYFDNIRISRERLLPAPADH